MGSPPLIFQDSFSRRENPSGVTTRLPQSSFFRWPFLCGRAGPKLPGRKEKPPPAPEYLQACADWQKRRNHWDVKPEWIVYTPGVNMALVCAIEMYTQPGDNVVIQSPVYYPYYEYVRVTGRNLAQNALDNLEVYYENNFEDLE